MGPNKPWRGIPWAVRTRLTFALTAATRRSSGSQWHTKPSSPMGRIICFFVGGGSPIFGQTWPQNPPRTTGLVLQCRLHQKSAPQTNSKARGLAVHWHSWIKILPLGPGPETFKIRPRRAGFQPPGPGETFVFLWRGRRLQPRVGGPGGGPVLAT